MVDFNLIGLWIGGVWIGIGITSLVFVRLIKSEDKKRAKLIAQLKERIK